MLNHHVIDATWDGDRGRWYLKIKNLETGHVIDWCNFMIHASGILNHWKWPDILGLKSFRGQLIHGAAWPDSADYHGKRVAVLGCGSSGIQIVPTIQPDVEQLVNFIRTST
ncbi:hypothetical protein JDV02_007321 [Purpureocillium takamizusanense]|uniref:Monooxygenase n=1 Tax=Purpureocillium takamizusanense TaxID=2060973 RepID=A0A9Q8QMT4_9HYPO|nr:uncharacterized protein JDV02_007321 [Purpureocillium takamizusanense]UNI21322.1 hypothetical protein JDV02_007321 [Purpureocillium takamizusanense]